MRGERHKGVGGNTMRLRLLTLPAGPSIVMPRAAQKLGFKFGRLVELEIVGQEIRIRLAFPPTNPETSYEDYCRELERRCDEDDER